MPFDVAALASAPAFSSGAITVALPFFAARMSGVYAPILVVARTFAPAYSSSCDELGVVFHRRPVQRGHAVALRAR